MMAVLLRVVLALIGLFRARAAAKADQAEAQAERVEAVRKDAAIREEVAKLSDGEARQKLRSKWSRLVILLALGVAVTACAGPPRRVVVDTACDWVRPILVADADILTDATARAILAHDEAWEARCGH